MVDKSSSLYVSYSDLHAAIQSGDADLVTRHLASGADINYLFGMKGTPLCAAVGANKLGVVSCLVEAGCDVNAKDYDGEPPLCMAIRKGFSPVVDFLIRSKGINLDKVDPITGDHPLVIAVKLGDVNTVSLLLQYGCNVNKKSSRCSYTAMHEAVRFANEDKMDCEKDASFRKSTAIKMIELLLEKQASITELDDNGFNPLHLAVNFQNIEMVKLILGLAEQYKGAVDRYTGQCHDFMEYLLDQRCRFSQDTVLHIACAKANPVLAELFLSLGAKINQTNREKQFPLLLACAGNTTCINGMNFQVVQILLKYKPELNLLGNMHTPLSISERTCSPLHAAVTKGNKEIGLELVKTLVAAGASVNKQDSLGDVPLVYALELGRFDIADYLLSDDCPQKVDLFVISKFNESLLWPAIQCSRAAQYVRILLEKGLDCDHRSSKGQTPIKEAFDKLEWSVVPILAGFGADLNDMSSGICPLHICASENLVSPAKVLLYHGADMYTKTADGESVMEIALECESVDIIRLLVACGYDLSKEDLQEYRTSEDIPIFLEEETDLVNVILESAKYPRPLSLKLQCRHTIRSHMLCNKLKLFSLDQCKLPRALTDFLLYKDIEINSCD